MPEGCPVGVLVELDRLVEERLRERPPGSYTVELAERGRGYVARKLGEEAVEAIVAALVEDPGALAREAADLLYHLVVLLRVSGLSLCDALRVLEERRRAKGGGAPVRGG